MRKLAWFILGSIIILYYVVSASFTLETEVEEVSRTCRQLPMAMTKIC